MQIIYESRSSYRLRTQRKTRTVRGWIGSTFQRLELISWATGTGLASGEVEDREFAQNDDAHSRIVDSIAPGTFTKQMYSV